MKFDHKAFIKLIVLKVLFTVSIIVGVLTLAQMMRV